MLWHLTPPLAMEAAMHKMRILRTGDETACRKLLTVYQVSPPPTAEQIAQLRDSLWRRNLASPVIVVGGPRKGPHYPQIEFRQGRKELYVTQLVLDVPGKTILEKAVKPTHAFVAGFFRQCKPILADTFTRRIGD